MMKAPVHTDLQHLAPGYDPAKARAYYLRTRHLKGRHKGFGPPITSPKNPFVKEGIRNLKSPKPSKTKMQQKKELAQKIRVLESKLVKLEALIHKKEQEASSQNRKSLAKKERAAKNKNTPKTAAEKAKLDRANKQYRDKNQQKLKTKAKQTSNASGGGHASSTTQTKSSGTSLEHLVKLAVKVKGQIMVAKQKLAAL